MINYPPAPLTGQIHTYLGNSWEYTGVGWKKYIAPIVPATSWPLLPLLVAIGIDTAPEQLALPLLSLLVEHSGGTEVSATGLTTPIPQPLMLTYI